MPDQLQIFPVEFRGGLISNLSPLQHGMNAVGSATMLQNFEPAKDGGYKKILGYTKYIAGSVPGSGAILGVNVANADEVVCVRKNGSNKSEYYINSGAAWSSLGAAALLGTKTRAAHFNFNGTPKIMFVDGVNSPAVFNDSTNTLSWIVPGVPTLALPADLIGASHVAVLNGTIFVANQNKVIFSSLYNELDWSAASGGGIINVASIVTGLIVFRDQLIIFTENSIKVITGNTSSDFNLGTITSDLGCPFTDTIQEVGGDIVFMGPDGIRYLSASQRIDDFGLELASAPIAKDMKTFIASATEFCSLVLREKAQYRVFSYVSTNTADLSKGLLATKFSNQDSSDMQWATMVGYKAYCADGRYASGREIVVFANDDGYIYKAENGSSRDGAVIQAVYKSPFMPITDPTKRKTVYKMTLYTKTSGDFSANINFYYDDYKIDNYNPISPPQIVISNASSGIFTWGSPTTLWGTFTYGDQLDNIYESHVIGAGKTVSFSIEDNSLNPSFSLDTVVLEYRENDRR